jgi:hypothetical protein
MAGGPSWIDRLAVTTVSRIGSICRRVRHHRSSNLFGFAMRRSPAYHVPTKGYPVPRGYDIFELMVRSSMTSRLLLALALLGLVLGPIGASSAGPAMAAQTMAPMADGMGCCPDHQPAVPDCGNDCPLAVLCVSALPSISIPEVPYLVRMPIRDEFREGRKMALASLIGEPPPRPPKV